MKKFEKPDFADKGLELRSDGVEVAIYGSKEGLKKLSDLLLKLIDNPSEGHIHLEDYELLTDKSLKGQLPFLNRLCEAKTFSMQRMSPLLEGITDVFILFRVVITVVYK